MKGHRVKVVMLGQMPPPLHGVTTVNQSIVDSAVLRRRFDFRVIPLRFTSDIGNIGRFAVRKVLRTFLIAVRLAGSLAFHRPALVYFTLCPRGGGFLRDLLFVGVIKTFAVPRIYHLHGKGVREASERSRVLRLLYAWCFDGADVIHVSRVLFEDVRPFIPDHRLFAVPNGFLGPRALPDRQNWAGQGGPRIAFISSMLAQKGPLVLLAALSLLKERQIPFCAEFAGPWREQAVKDAFARLLSEHDLSGPVRYVGAVSGSEKHDFFLRSHILAFPTLSDAFGLVAVEAMAYGLPVVASCEGALVEIVDEGKTGYLVPKNDPVALADALQRLLENSDLRARMGRAGRKRYEQNYRLGIFEERLAGALEACIARRSV